VTRSHRLKSSCKILFPLSTCTFCANRIIVFEFRGVTPLFLHFPQAYPRKCANLTNWKFSPCTSHRACLHSLLLLCIGFDRLNPSVQFFLRNSPWPIPTKVPFLSPDFWGNLAARPCVASQHSCHRHPSRFDSYDCRFTSGVINEWASAPKASRGYSRSAQLFIFFASPVRDAGIARDQIEKIPASMKRPPDPL